MPLYLLVVVLTFIPGLEEVDIAEAVLADSPVVEDSLAEDFPEVEDSLAEAEVPEDFKKEKSPNRTFFVSINQCKYLEGNVKHQHNLS